MYTLQIDGYSKYYHYEKSGKEMRVFQEVKQTRQWETQFTTTSGRNCGVQQKIIKGSKEDLRFNNNFPRGRFMQAPSTHPAWHSPEPAQLQYILHTRPVSFFSLFTSKTNHKNILINLWKIRNIYID